MRPLYIFNIDGTLCNIEHRLHFLDNKADRERWDKFYRCCVFDVPNKPVLNTMTLLKRMGAEIWFFSGRSSVVREQTLDWLCKYSDFQRWEFDAKPELLAFTEDHLLKQSWLNNMLPEDCSRLVAVFEDRKRVVDMWRANNIACFQVADGEF